MKTYCTFFDTDSGPTAMTYFGTLKEAHDNAKELAKGAPTRAGDIRIELQEIATDKDGVLRLLNGDITYKVERTWGLTPRRGLMELPNGE